MRSEGVSAAGRTPGETYHGGLAGENIRNGWLQLLMPCPNPQKLTQIVAPVFDSFDWQNEKRMTSRKAPYWDMDAADTGN